MSSGFSCIDVLPIAQSALHIYEYVHHVASKEPMRQLLCEMEIIARACTRALELLE